MADQLRQLFEQTSFSKMKSDHIAWDRIKIEPDRELPLGIYVYVPQSAHFADTLIALDDVYENSGVDCLFVQELIRMYAAGELTSANNT